MSQVAARFIASSAFIALLAGCVTNGAQERVDPVQRPLAQAAPGESETMMSFNTPSGEARLLRDSSDSYSIYLPETGTLVDLSHLGEIRGLSTHPVAQANRQVALVEGQTEECPHKYSLITFGTASQDIEAQNLTGCSLTYSVEENRERGELAVLSSGLEPVAYYYSNRGLLGPTHLPNLGGVQSKHSNEVQLLGRGSSGTSASSSQPKATPRSSGSSGGSAPRTVTAAPQPTPRQLAPVTQVPQRLSQVREDHLEKPVVRLD